MLAKLLISSLLLAISLTLISSVAHAGKNRIVELKGEAQIKFKGRTNYQPVFQGMTLILGDILLDTSKNANYTHQISLVGEFLKKAECNTNSFHRTCQHLRALS